jgi:sec-independent protein translocase protein TatC
MSAARARRLLSEQQEPSRFGDMSLLEHLEEFRIRLVRAALAIAVGMGVAFAFIVPLKNFVLAPAIRALPPGVTLIYTQPTEAFGFYMQVALIGGVLLASPLVVYQFWRFIAPALYANEKRFVIPFVGLSTAGAVGGFLFGHYVMFPYMLAFFGTFNGAGLTFMPTLASVFGMYQKTVLAMAITFQIPTLAYFLARMRLVTARFLWRHFKYAFLGTFIVSAILTPSPDPYNQTLFALPMIGLYLVSIVICWAARPRD